MAPPVDLPQSVDDLAACVRDLVALSTMPAWWVGRAPLEIADSLRDLLVSMLRADEVAVELHERFVPMVRSAPWIGAPLPGHRRPEGNSHRTRASPTLRSDAERALHHVTGQIGLDGELGRLDVWSARPEFPEPLEMLLMQVAANQVSVALQHADLLIRHEHAERMLAARASQQAVVARLGLRALRASSTSGLLVEAVQTVRATMQADRCEIAALEDDDTTLVIRAADGWPASVIGERERLGSDTVHGRVALEQRSLIVNELASDRRFAVPSLLHAVGTVSGAAVIIHCPNGAFGVLGVHTNKPREFTADDVHFLESVASILAAAIERLRNEAEREMLLAHTATAQAEAERSSLAKSQFLGIMSHELRTPLNAIGGYAQLMEDEIRGPVTSEQRADLARIRRSQKHLLSVIDNVLGFLKLGSGQMQYDIQEVAVDDVIHASEELTRPLMEAKRLRFAATGLGEGLRVHADSGKLQQIVVNLLSNATKFTDAGGSIEVACRGAAASIYIRVADTGRGIPPDRLESVFEPFIQLGAGERTTQGTGLGLSISRDFARGMRGNLRVRSELGVGSAFTIELPRVLS
jgi:signal transduction histidine kinase